MNTKRIRDYGIMVGELPTGMLNKISDVPGVTVGHYTLDNDRHKTGVTVILPAQDNLFSDKMTAAVHVINGFGKTCGTVQVDELGTLETPIALTNTLGVGAVHDAIVGYMFDLCWVDGFRLTSVNPVVCECNDSQISRIEERAVTATDVLHAIQTADTVFEQGSVGAGRGTICYGMKGGIGSASRQIKLGDETFTIGVLVQSNYGASSDFLPTALPPALAECDKGSIIIIVATDLPLTCRQLKRVLKRTSVGMARLGSYIGHGSGEIAVGFTTAPRIDESKHFQSIRMLREEDMNLPFRAVGEATEEAILHSMLHSDADTDLDGRVIPSLKQYFEQNQK